MGFFILGMFLFFVVSAWGAIILDQLWKIKDILEAED